MRRAILDAANALLQESGLRAFTIEEVATRSGAAKTTIYRWWQSKGTLAVESFLIAMAPRLAYPESESPAEDIRRQLHLVARAFRGPAGATMAGLLAEGQYDAEASSALLDHYFRPRRAEAARAIRRGIESGQFRPDIDIDAFIDLLYGPIYYRLLAKHANLDAEFVNTTFDMALKGVVPRSDTASKRRVAAV